jgi:hypothetical protein
VAESDREVQDKLRSFLKDDTEAVVSHFIAERTEIKKNRRPLNLKIY